MRACFIGAVMGDLGLRRRRRPDPARRSGSDGSITPLATATVGAGGAWSTTVPLSGDGAHRIAAEVAAVGGAPSNLVGSGTTYTAIFAAAASTDINEEREGPLKARAVKAALGEPPSRRKSSGHGASVGQGGDRRARSEAREPRLTRPGSGLNHCAWSGG